MAFAVESLPYGPGIFVILITLISMAYRTLVVAPARFVSALWCAVNWEAVRGFCFAVGIVLLNVGVVVLLVITDTSYSPG